MNATLGKINLKRVAGEGLGYKKWLVLDGPHYGAADVIKIGDNEFAHCHPVIAATELHAKEIDGLEVGDKIAGVRWTEPFNRHPRYAEGHYIEGVWKGVTT